MKYIVLCIFCTVFSSQELTKKKSLIASVTACIAGITGYSLWKAYHKHAALYKACLLEFKDYKQESGTPIIFVHGTLFPFNKIPGIRTLLELYEIKKGKHSIFEMHYPAFHGAIPPAMHSDEFPLQDFHYFGWSGDLSYQARKVAAQHLYHAIKDTKHKKLVAHSHGGNVILTTAAIAAEHPDMHFSVDTVILLALPVQMATASYALDNTIFKEIFTFYSARDLIQIADPQRLYQEAPAHSPFFSQRKLPHAAHIKQARLLIHNKDPYHVSFIGEPILKKIPYMIKMMRASKKHDFTFNIIGEQAFLVTDALQQN